MHRPIIPTVATTAALILRTDMCSEPFSSFPCAWLNFFSHMPPHQYPVACPGDPVLERCCYMSCTVFHLWKTGWRGVPAAGRQRSSWVLTWILNPGPSSLNCPFSVPQHISASAKCRSPVWKKTSCPPPSPLRLKVCCCHSAKVTHIFPCTSLPKAEMWWLLSSSWAKKASSCSDPSFKQSQLN